MKIKSIIKDKYENGNLKGQLQTAALVTGVSICLGIGIKYGKKEDLSKAVQITDESYSKYEYGYDELKDCVLLSIKNNNNRESTIYIANKTGSNNFTVIYTDLFSEKELVKINAMDEFIGKKKGLSCIEKGNLRDYLVTSDNLKDTYTKSDLEKILNNVKEVEKSNKQLIK